LLKLLKIIYLIEKGASCSKMKIRHHFNITLPCLLIAILMAGELHAGRHSAVRKPVAPGSVQIEPTSEDVVVREKTEPLYPSLGSGSPDLSEHWINDMGAEPKSRRYSLEDCVDLALERNRRITAAGYDVEAAEGQLTEAKALFWPVMEYTYRVAPVPKDLDNAFNDFFRGNVTLFNSFHVGIAAPITTFGRLNTAKKMAERGVDAAQAKRRSMQYDTIFQVKKIYFGLQLARETERILEDAISKMNNKIAEEDEKDIKDLDPFDIIQLKVFRNELERRLAETKENGMLALEGLKIQLDLDPNAEIELDSYNLKPLLHKLAEEKEYVEMAMEHQPESKLLDIGVDVKQKQYKLEKLKLLPKAGVGFFADVGRTVGEVVGPNFTDDYSNPFNYTRAGVGMQLSGDLDFHGAAGRIRKARAEYYKATYERHIARRGLGLEMKKAYQLVQRLKDDVGRANEAQSLAQQMTFLSKLNIDTGIGDESKYADALKLILLTRGQYFKTVFDFNVALADLERKIGMEKYNTLMSVSDTNEQEFFGIDRGDSFDFFEEDAVGPMEVENEDF